ncbi:MAG: 2-oxoglutarate dehydrogenase E1 component [Gammaproteobacteria bacterium]|nr:MAG: 2-oxoglutarate dehydrogenase E1 component [Gammaproteobacteria bacterium]
MKSLSDNTSPSIANSAYIESLYRVYRKNPDGVSKKWRRYFDNLEQLPETEVPSTGGAPCDEIENFAKKQSAVLQLINAYRFRAHQTGNWDPLQYNIYEPIEDLDPAFHGLSEEDMDTQFDTGSLCLSSPKSLREIISFIQSVYMGPIGAEYMHITSTEEKRWLQNYIESRYIDHNYTPEKQKRILQRLVAANTFERYLHTRYSGQKRFSLEGAESLIPLLDELIQHSGEENLEEISIGMSHRGRLNVLVNILGKPPEELFNEFEESQTVSSNSHTGDVKYHLGYSTDIETHDRLVHVALAFNPSHLEIIDPVLMGSVRARQRRRHDKHGESVLPILIHGDAAFAGQGVVMETFNMSQAKGYTVGGMIHIIVNNQIGFTTNPTEGRSAFYCTEIAKMVQAPILHVNGDHPECVAFVARLALDYRMTYNKDIVIDMVCVRRHGHNEADEPTVTQPLMYKKIAQLPTVMDSYARHLEDKGVISEPDYRKMIEAYRHDLDQGEMVALNVIPGCPNHYAAQWGKYDHHFGKKVNTAIDLARLEKIGKKAFFIPAEFTPHPTVRKIYTDRIEMLSGNKPVNWGCAEMLAYATLLDEGFHVRLSGQDSARGTFFHRHATLHDQENGETLTPLQHLGRQQGHFAAIDSPLSESAVLGFEYGYASTDPCSLVIWEAQYGDFANNAQAVIDQFISSAESKWNRLCGITLYLPHGQEGQGPEHSSARIERYMRLCAHHNMRVCQPTTPAQMFHLLRMQMHDNTRKPLIVFTPKSLLHHKKVVSPLHVLSEGSFQSVIADRKCPRSDGIHTMILCSGKIYYELDQFRQQINRLDIPLVRVEQLYPFPEKQLTMQFRAYPDLKMVIWVQEEAENQGAWYQIRHYFQRIFSGPCKEMGLKLTHVARPTSSSPAAGYSKFFRQQQDSILSRAFSIDHE